MFNIIRWYVILHVVFMVECTNQVFVISENHCVTNSSLPIISNAPLEEIYSTSKQGTPNKEYGNFTEDFDDVNICKNKSYCSGNWKIENSISKDESEIIRDRRWEDFKTYTLLADDYVGTDFQIPENNFKIPLSVRGVEIHLFFCTENNVSSACIWFILQGWKQNKTGVRQCTKDQIPKKKGISAEGDCKKLQKEVFHSETPLFFFKDHWSHIYVQKKGSTWSILQNETQIISLQGSNSDPYYKYLIMHANDDTTLIKVHEYKYLSSNSPGLTTWGPKIAPQISCVKLFIKMCHECSLNITVVFKTETIFEQVYNESKWTEITINLPKRDEEAQFYFKTEHKNADTPFWAVDKISTCLHDEIRMVPRKLNEDCELVNGFGKFVLKSVQYNKSKIDTESQCSDDEFGFNTCLPCTDEICKHTKYCEHTTMQNYQCSCFPGSYISVDKCIKCSSGYYGQNCTRRCHGCKRGCKYNGNCIGGECYTHYRGEKCNIPTYPVFINAPKVQEIKPTSARFIVENLTLYGDGKENVTEYVIQLRELNKSWITIETKRIEETYNSIYNNLKPETNYLIRAIAYPNLTKEDKGVDKYVDFKTPCKYITREQIDVIATRSNITLIFGLNDKNCNITNYKIEDFGMINSNPFVLDRLEPYTDYEFKMEGPNKFIITAKTLEGLPGRVGSIHVSKVTSNSAFLNWSPPSKPNGIITKYEVEYFASQSRVAGCLASLKQSTSKHVLQESKFHLTNLSPYMKYTVIISAFTTIGKGSPTEFSFETSQIDIVSPIKYRLEPMTNGLAVTFPYDKCKQEGPLYANASVTCLSKWCQNDVINQSFQDITLVKTCTVTDLIPYTEYSFEIFLSRSMDGHNPYKIVDKLSTLESEPNVVRGLEVYSIETNKDDKRMASISLRWLPPYPPHGNISNYLINYYYYYWKGKSKHNIECQYTTCQIWPDYICCTIKNDIWYEYVYTFNVMAVNQKQLKSQPITLQYRPLKSNKTKVPWKVITEWNDDNSLKLSWNHPNFTNGQIIYFKYTIEGNHETFNVTQENLTYTKNNIEVTLEEEISILIMACTIEDCSYNTGKKVLSPPPKASLPTMVDTDFFNNTIIITLPEIKKNCKKCTTNVTLAIAKGTKKFKNIAEYYPTNDTLIIVDNSTTKLNNTIQMLINPPLQSETNYTLNIKVVNTYKGTKSSTERDYKISTKGVIEEINNKTSKNLSHIAFILLPLIAVAIFIYIKKKKNPNVADSMLDDPVDSKTGRNRDDKIGLLHTVTQETNVIIKPQVKDRVKTRKPYRKPNTTHSKLVLQGNFEKYIRTSLQSDDLRKQHELIPKGQLHPWTYAAKKENKPKNRYTNLLAYDHSRVLLNKIEGDDFSDYINASWIDSYDTKNAYIATQGPKPNTLNDFWRMIWQENVRTIVMLANLVENGKKKVEQYWPVINEENSFGDILVCFDSEVVFANYVERIFNVAKDGEERKLTQFHFTSWPDHGIPLYSQSLVPFLKRLLNIDIKSSSPVVVHCSAGVGRTGTVILCDMTLRLARTERKIDILNYLEYIRQRRANMVDNYEQYKLVHFVVLECLNGMNSSIPCNENMPTLVKQMINCEAEEQMKYLRDIEWQDHAMKSIISTDELVPLESAKNRVSSVVPELSGRIYLNPFPLNDLSSSYINAVHVEGFLNPNRFIATQQPLPNTVGDFWRMVLQMECSVIINLNELNPQDNTSIQYWPNENEKLRPTTAITVHNVKTESYELFKIICLYVMIDDERHDVDLILYNNWKSHELTPNNIQQFVSFMEESDSLLRKSNPAIIMCFDGVTACGIFLALSFIIEKMKLEHECDVCQAVRYIRHNRREFISRKEQFVFLYKAALEYIRGFQSYANFN